MIKLFAAAREAAGVGEDEIEASTVEEILINASHRYGQVFEESLAFCKVAVNGTLIDETQFGTVGLGAADEVAILPPVSGG